jgi:hypothetical protein
MEVLSLLLLNTVLLLLLLLGSGLMLLWTSCIPSWLETSINGRLPPWRLTTGPWHHLQQVCSLVLHS